MTNWTVQRQNENSYAGLSPRLKFSGYSPESTPISKAFINLKTIALQEVIQCNNRFAVFTHDTLKTTYRVITTPYISICFINNDSDESSIIRLYTSDADPLLMRAMLDASLENHFTRPFSDLIFTGIPIAIKIDSATFGRIMPDIINNYNMDITWSFICISSLGIPDEVTELIVRFQCLIKITHNFDYDGCRRCHVLYNNIIDMCSLPRIFPGVLSIVC